MSEMDAQILHEVLSNPNEKWTETHSKQLFQQAALHGSPALLKLANHLLMVEADLSYHISLREADAAGVAYYTTE